MEVYVLCSGRDESSVEGVFSSEEKARCAAIKKHFYSEPAWFKVEYDLYVAEFNRLGHCPIHYTPHSEATFIDDCGKTAHLRKNDTMFGLLTAGPMFTWDHMAAGEAGCPGKPETEEEAAMKAGEYFTVKLVLDEIGQMYE